MTATPSPETRSTYGTFVDGDQRVIFFIDHQSFEIRIRYDEEEPAGSVARRARAEWYARNVVVALARLATNGGDVASLSDYRASVKEAEQ